MTSLTAPRQLPWDAMGGALTTDATTVAGALAQKGLDYTVEVRHARSGNAFMAKDEPAGAALLAKRDHLEAPSHQAIVRPMPGGQEKVLAFTRRRYTPIQNRDGFQVADTLVREFGAQITGAADYRSGEKSILVVTLPENIVLEGRDGTDPTSLNLVITNDHAGNGALTLALTPVRIACTNVLPAAIKGAERVWKISHTPKAQARLDLAADAIVKAVAYRDAFQEQAQAMLDQEMVDAEFRKMVAKLYPVKRDAEGVAAERKRDLHSTLMTMWNSSPTIQGISGTRWAGYNVVTEYLDHMRPVRSEASVARAEGALDGPYVRQKAALWIMFAAA
jgi:phage/plasmid-like protein (TIGR03299 family)